MQESKLSAEEMKDFYLSVYEHLSAQIIPAIQETVGDLLVQPDATTNETLEIIQQFLEDVRERYSDILELHYELRTTLTPGGHLHTELDLMEGPSPVLMSGNANLDFLLQWEEVRGRTGHDA